MKKLYRFLIKTLLCFILFLILGILCKKNSVYKKYIQEKIYQDSLSFSYFKTIYNRYLGGVFPIENVTNVKTTSVFNEKLEYYSISSYLEGALLEVSDHYLVSNLTKGIVVYIGEKEGYNQVIMVENDDGIDIWYGNMCNVLVKLYDNLDSGSYLGESCDNKLYLVYSKGNEYLNYEDYFG